MGFKTSLVTGLVVSFLPAMARAQPGEPADTTDVAPPAPSAAPMPPVALAPPVVVLAPPPPLTPPPPPPTLVARDGYPLAGRVGEHFYLRDAHDDFRIYFSGRAHIDAFVPFGAGVSASAPGSGLLPTVFLRRARPELAGEFLGRWQWLVSGDWGRTAVSNGNGQTETTVCSANAKTGAQTCSVRTAAVQAPSYTAQPTDVFINFHAVNLFNVEVGQFKIPFGMENRTSENYTPFLESSLPIRNIGAPQNRDIGIMAWGEAPKSLVHYEVGLFNGDGPDVTNQDSNFDGIGRVFAHPFATTASPVKTLQIGVSGRYGVRSARTVGYDYTALTTQEGYAFWKPTYTDSNGYLVHILPSNRQITVGGELYWPLSIVDLTSEVVYASHDTREARDGFQTAYPSSERYGEMTGYSYYVEAAVWLMGDRQYVRRPGYVDPPHVDFKAPLPPSTSSIELLAKFEQLALHYGSAARAGTANSKSPDGDIDVNVVSFGANFWATRRVRVSLNYDLNLFPGSEPGTPSTPTDPKQTSAQRAVGPAQLIATGTDDAAREGAHTLHELSARVAVGF